RSPRLRVLPAKLVALAAAQRARLPYEVVHAAYDDRANQDVHDKPEQRVDQEDGQPSDHDNANERQERVADEVALVHQNSLQSRVAKARRFTRFVLVISMVTPNGKYPHIPSLSTV